MSYASPLSKEDPEYKEDKVPIDGKIYFSYVDIHQTVSSMVPKIREFGPSVIIAIGGGGFIPARILRTELKIPMLAVSLQLYDGTNTARSTVEKVQWFDEESVYGSKVRGKKVLIVDEIDDTRLTLQYCVQELMSNNSPGQVVVAVVHNKLKVKKGKLPDDVIYFAGADVEDHWICYPWDAWEDGNTILEHEKLARKCVGSSVNSS